MWREIGMRFHPTRGAMSLGKSKGGLPPDGCCEEEDAILKEMKRCVETYHDNSRLVVGTLLRLLQPDTLWSLMGLVLKSTIYCALIEICQCSSYSLPNTFLACVISVGGFSCKMQDAGISVSFPISCLGLQQWQATPSRFRLFTGTPCCALVWRHVRPFQSPMTWWLQQQSLLVSMMAYACIHIWQRIRYAIFPSRADPTHRDTSLEEKNLLVLHFCQWSILIKDELLGRRKPDPHAPKSVHDSHTHISLSHTSFTIC